MSDLAYWLIFLGLFIVAFAVIEISRHRALVRIAELAVNAGFSTRPEEDSE